MCPIIPYITGNSTTPTRFRHPTAGTCKKEMTEEGKKNFSVAYSGTGRTLHPDNMAANHASYGMTDILGRMALQRTVRRLFFRSRPNRNDRPVGNNLMVGATVAVAVAVEEAQK